MIQWMKKCLCPPVKVDGDRFKLYEELCELWGLKKPMPFVDVSLCRLCNVLFWGVWLGPLAVAVRWGIRKFRKCLDK